MAILQRSWKTLSVSLTDAILTISMNRPKANAMSAELLNELIDAFHQASDDHHVNGVLLRSNLSSTFSAGADLSSVYNLAIARHRPSMDSFVFNSLSRGLVAPLHCSKPVACALDGHTIAGGLIIALACDYIAIGTRKPFRIGITGPIVGIPYPLRPVKLAQHQLEPQLAYRLLVDAQVFSSADFPLKCARSDTPDDLARKWLKMVGTRPLQGFQITKKKWWSRIIQLDAVDNEREKEEYFQAITSDECLRAMEKALTKEKK